MSAIDLQFQAVAGEADDTISLALAKLEAQGRPAEMIAAGALHAVVRYHMKHLKCVLAERPVLAILYPAVAGCVTNILNASKAAHDQAEADAHAKN